MKALTMRPLALAVSALIGGTAFAQEALEEITVTGSRIARRDLTAPTPIVTVDSERFQNTASVSVERTLNQLPQFVPQGTQFLAGIQGGATSSPGAATLNLRGLGPNRNLVLIDGRRAQPVNASLVIDINTIPASAIESVEVITGGASAVYGPDALAGVTNFILKKDFEGVEIGLRTGEAGEGDGTESAFSMLVGMNSADGNGNVLVGIDWTERDPIYQRDRDFFVNGWRDPGNPSGSFMQPRSFGAGEGANLPGGPNPPSQAAVDAVFVPLGAPASPLPGNVGRNSEFRFNADGSLFVTQQGYGYNGPLNCLDCGPFTMIKRLTNGNLDQPSTVAQLSTPLERFSSFLRGRYDIGDNLTAFAQANYSNIEVTTFGGIPPAITVWQSPVPRDARVLPAALNTLLDSRANPAGPWSLYQVLDYNGPIQRKNKNDVWQLMAGLEGEFGESVSWEAYISRGNTDIESINFRLPSLQRYQFLIQQPNFGRGVNLRPPVGMIGAGRGYVINCPTGLPVFQDFTPDPSCLNAIDTLMIDRSELRQDIAEFNLNGSAFSLPGGDVGYALGASYRKNEYAYNPGNPIGQLADNPIGIFASNPTGGETDVTEYYGEVLLPVVDRLDLEFGYRYSDFNTAGGHDTYKSLFTFQANDSITLRGGYQFATRAPNVAELFTANTQVVVFHPDQDPCSVTTLSPWGNVPGNPNRLAVQNLCRAIIGNSTSGFDTQTYSITGIPGPSGFHRQNPPFFPLEIELRKGNPKVGPETAQTYTLGAVFNGPLGLDNLTITADLYQMEIKEAISPIAAYVVYNNCFNWNGSTNPTLDIANSFCQMIRRNPSSGDREEVDAPFYNLGLIETQGLDLNVNWSTELGPGTFGVNSNINYLDTYEYQVAPGDRVIDAKGTLDQFGLYDLRMLTNLSYSWNNFYLGLGWNYLSDIKAAAAASNPNTTIRGTGSYSLYSLNSSYEWSKYTIRMGIDNLLDEDPRVIGANPGIDSNTDSTLPQFYDAIGRSYYIGFTASF